MKKKKDNHEKKCFEIDFTRKALMIIKAIFIVGLLYFFLTQWDKPKTKLDPLELCAARFYVGAKGTTLESVKEKCRNGELPLE